MNTEPLPGSLVTVMLPPIIGRKRLPTRAAALAPMTGNPNEALAPRSFRAVAASPPVWYQSRRSDRLFSIPFHRIRGQRNHRNPLGAIPLIPP